MEGALYWAVAAAAIVGVVLNIRKHVACFHVWFCTNLVWAYADLRHGLPAQAALQVVYAVLSVYGIVQWKRMETTTSRGTERSEA